MTQKTYEQIHKHDLSRADFKDCLGGPLRDGCFKLSIAGPVDAGALKRIRRQLDLAIEIFEEPAPSEPPITTEANHG